MTTNCHKMNDAELKELRNLYFRIDFKKETKKL